MFNIIGAMAEFEREVIRERVRAGMKNAKAKGARIGRPRANVDPSQIARLRAEGRTIREISGALSLSRSLVHKTLANHQSHDAANAEG
jgi:putative DNA-invertase from lambdoid prophage Rac